MGINNEVLYFCTFKNLVYSMFLCCFAVFLACNLSLHGIQADVGGLWLYRSYNIIAFVTDIAL